MKKIISPISGKEKYLLIENCEFISNVKISQDLKESLSLSNGKAGTLIVKNLPGTVLNRENQNGRVYSTTVLEQAIREAKPLFETKQLLSTGDEHPEGSFVAPTHASHVVTNAYIKRNVRVTVDEEVGNYDMLFMDIEVLNTVEGKNLRALLEAECSVGTSIRGIGDMEGKYVKNYEILGIDFVGNPSSSTYTRMPVSESVELEIQDPRALTETYAISTSSTDVVRDLEQASELQQRIEARKYGTVAKTSTKVEQEVDPKTGAETSITTLETETNDEVSDLDQALGMVKNAMLNGVANIDSITIENIQEEEPKESVEEYIPEDEGLVENPMTEAKEDKEEDPNLGKKFVLHTDRGFVTFDKNAIDFTDKPADALHFTEGKEEAGMVSMSKVTEILDAMGIFEVKKYFQRNNMNLKSDEQISKEENGQQTSKKEGLLSGIAQDAITDESTITEENGSNTKYMAKITINDDNGSNNETIAVSSVDLDSAKNEISNLWEMKSKTVSGQGTIDIYLIDTITGDQFHYNPESQLLESGKDTTEDNFENPTVCSWCKETCEQIDCKKEKDMGWLCDQCQRALESRGVGLEFEEEGITEDIKDDKDTIEIDNNKVTTKLDDDTTIEKDFDSPIQAQVATAAVAQGKVDPKVLVPEANVKEKLYNNPSEPSDELVQTPLKDATEDLLVTLKDIDWDIEAIINSLDDGEDVEEVIEALPDPWTIRVNAVDLDSADLKAAILNAANEQAPWAINNATIDKIEDPDTRGMYYSAEYENRKDNPVDATLRELGLALDEDDPLWSIINELFDEQERNPNISWNDFINQLVDILNKQGDTKLADKIVWINNNVK